MSWCCLTSGDERSCNKDFRATLEMTTTRSVIKTPRRCHIFMRRTFPEEPEEPVEPTEPSEPITPVKQNQQEKHIQ